MQIIRTSRELVACRLILEDAVVKSARSRGFAINVEPFQECPYVSVIVNADVDAIFIGRIKKMSFEILHLEIVANRRHNSTFIQEE